MSPSSDRVRYRRITAGFAVIATCVLVTTVVLTSATRAHSDSFVATAPATAPATAIAPIPAQPATAVIATAAPTPAATPAPATLQVLTIGDSIMRGYGLNQSEAWPELISAQTGWQLSNLACDGAGFLTVGSPTECGSTFVEVSRSAADLNPDIIIIEGSSNDFGQSNPELQEATDTALQLLRSEFPGAEIIGLSTVWSETTPPDQLATINSQVQQAVAAVGGTYLDIGQPMSGHPELMQDDDVHPTAAGQEILAVAIRAAISADQTAITAAQVEAADTERAASATHLDDTIALSHVR